MTEFDPKYHEAEEEFRTEAAALHERNNEIQARIRGDVNATAEEREERYMREYARLNEQFEALANAHALAVTQDRRALEEKVYSGAGDKFSDHITQLANIPDEKLEGLMKTAERTKQTDLARAIAQVALDRNRFGVFEEWAASNPETAEALKRLRTLPDDDRLRTRTLTMRPFKAAPEGLTPRQEDRDREANKAAAAAATKDEFFGRGPRRQVGSRVS